ncbi:MAG: hypothetical protein K6G00_00990 [Treponema sp.]|nr:hypothetical protein [Treponema sp.]
MSENILFKDYVPSDYIKFAEQAAAWIKTARITGMSGTVWSQSPDSKEDFSDYPMLTPKSLYGGSSGVGLFYLRLYQVTKNSEYLKEAESAAKHIIETDEGISFYDRTLNSKAAGTSKLVHVKNMPGWAAGYYNGPTGSAYLILKLFELTGNKNYKDYAVKVADDLLSVAKKSDEGIYWSEQNDLCGDAGFITYLYSIYKLTKDDRYIDAAKNFGNFLLSKGKQAPNGGTYWNVVDLTIIDFPKDVFWVNHAHGTSGVGWIFTILYNLTSDERFLDAAREAAKYIEGIAVGDENAVLVPYLDSLERGPSTEFYYLSTCHGPAGTSILFQSLYRITGDKNYLDWVLKLSRGIIKAGAPEIFSRGYWQSQALCCGTPGLVEHFVSVYRLTKDPEFLDYAKRAAKTVVGQSFVEDADGDIYHQKAIRRWSGAWWRTIPSDVHSYTGLYIGTAGNAWALLSLAAAEKNERLIELIEYSYFK